MNHSDYTLHSSKMPSRKRMSVTRRLFRNLICKQLGLITTGGLSIRENGEVHQFGDSESFLSVELVVEDAEFWQQLALGGTTGAGESYMQGYWRCNDLVGLVRLFIRNRQVLAKMDDRLSRLALPLHKVLHFLNRNTASGSRKNIAAHYDLGNEFFALFLDSKMMYSSAFYPSEDATLEQASSSKLDRICRKLNLTAEDHVIEIGTGWGGIAIYAAQQYGCRVTTTTISAQQFSIAQQRVQAAGLESRITLLQQDYRDLQGQYDKLVSIEMIEAVGHQYLNTYIKQCDALLKPNGSMLIQAITIADQQYESAIREVDFIKKYIFPGGFLPSVEAMSSAIAQASSMRMVHLEDIGSHYARTLADWRTRFLEKLSTVKEQGYPSSFIRMWEFYLCYCEGGFLENYIGTVQLVAAKPNAKVLAYNPEIEVMS